jgi:hypothetical protein
MRAARNVIDGAPRERGRRGVCSNLTKGYVRTVGTHSEKLNRTSLEFAMWRLHQIRDIVAAAIKCLVPVPTQFWEHASQNWPNLTLYYSNRHRGPSPTHCCLRLGIE